LGRVNSSILRYAATLLCFALAGRAISGAQTSASVWSGVYTEEQAKRGARVYTRTCALCHGADLAGVDQAPPLVGPAFLPNWTGQSVGALFDQTRKSMPKDEPGTLPRQEYLDIIAHLLSANGFPAGKADLPADAATLALIQIDAKPAN
jgi:quinoprotein glucose dehydrogenase